MNALEFRFAFYARDFEKSVRFYQETLELQFMRGWDREDGKGALLSAGCTAVVEIYGAANNQTYDGPGPVAINLAFRLEDATAVDQFYQKLAAKGTDKIRAPKNYHWGHRSFRMYDPDDIPIYVYCEL